MRSCAERLRINRKVDEPLPSPEADRGFCWVPIAFMCPGLGDAAVTLVRLVPGAEADIAAATAASLALSVLWLEGARNRWHAPGCSRWPGHLLRTGRY